MGVLFCNAFDYVQWESPPAEFRWVKSPFLAPAVKAKISRCLVWYETGK